MSLDVTEQAKAQSFFNNDHKPEFRQSKRRDTVETTLTFKANMPELREGASTQEREAQLSSFMKDVDTMATKHFGKQWQTTLAVAEDNKVGLVLTTEKPVDKIELAGKIATFTGKSPHDAGMVAAKMPPPSSGEDLYAAGAYVGHSLGGGPRPSVKR